MEGGTGRASVRVVRCGVALRCRRTCRLCRGGLAHHPFWLVHCFNCPTARLTSSCCASGGCRTRQRRPSASELWPTVQGRQGLQSLQRIALRECVHAFKWSAHVNFSGASFCQVIPNDFRFWFVRNTFCSTACAAATGSFTDAAAVEPEPGMLRKAASSSSANSTPANNDAAMSSRFVFSEPKLWSLRARSDGHGHSPVSFSRTSIHSFPRYESASVCLAHGYAKLVALS